MNIYELKEILPIHEDTIDAVERVKKITGKDMDFIMVDTMLSHAKLKAARQFMPHHIVYLRKDKIPHINHLIVHECYHLFRFWTVSHEQRLILSTPISERQKKINKWKQELGSKQNMYNSEAFGMWNNGYMTLFYNAVTDTRIERAIYTDYPNLRHEQLASLKALEEEVVLSLDKQIERIMPHSAFVEIHAMNYAFLKQLEPIVGRMWRKHYKGRSEIIELGNRLFRVVPEKDEGLNQDIAILNKWSSILDTSLEWIDFEDVPFNYVHQY